MPANIESIKQKAEGDTSRVDIALIGEADVKAFREDKTYVVDVSFEQAQKPPQAAGSPEPKSPPPGASPGDRASEIVPPTSEQIAREAALDVRPDVKLPAIVSDEKVAPIALQQEATAEAVPAPAPKPVAAAEPPAKMPPPPEPPSAPKKASPPDIAAPNAAPGVVVDARLSSDDFRLTFPFKTPTAAAVFRRSDSIWLVFDTEQAIDASAIRREGAWIVADTTGIDLPKGRALRIKLNRPQLAALINNELGWTLVLADKALSPPQPLVATRNMADPSRASVSVTLAKSGQLHRISDPDAGDPLLVMTAGGPVRGFIKRQEFVEFSILESIHGVVIQQKSDDVTAGISSDTLTLTRPGGLTLSTAMTAPEHASAAIRPIFDTTEWRAFQTADFMSLRNKLMTAAALSTGLSRLPAHVNLARFYLAQGLYPEAKGILDLVFADAKPGEEEASSLTLHAVASTLAGRPELALADLASPAITANIDSQLWRALAYARQRKWADAREKFKNVDFAITALPVDLQRIVIAEAFRASLEVRDYPGRSDAKQRSRHGRRGSRSDRINCIVARTAGRSAGP